MAKVKITDLILRDAHQSLIATRMTLDEMRPAFPLLSRSATMPSRYGAARPLTAACAS